MKNIYLGSSLFLRDIMTLNYVIAQILPHFQFSLKIIHTELLEIKILLIQKQKLSELSRFFNNKKPHNSCSSAQAGTQVIY
jgi:hypothetical protein